MSEISEKSDTELMKLTKKDLIQKLRTASIEVMTQEIENQKLQRKLDLAESYVEQGRAMIEAIMERWHEYDL